MLKCLHSVRRTKWLEKMKFTASNTRKLNGHTKSVGWHVVPLDSSRKGGGCKWLQMSLLQDVLKQLVFFGNGHTKSVASYAVPLESSRRGRMLQMYPNVTFTGYLKRTVFLWELTY
ncbi:hypothetical protein CDAR_222301 [Caerostris darwini]|uniref:Uncharacterized protein n=1 Tax=Caerostris darwini TaxID=1538125 RepID=A0AAV4RPC2_9ARAC|nr:hypothetical protein CDAR_222301 [Caerostris darwini]